MTPFSNIQETTDNESLRELRDEVKDLNKTFKKAIKSSDRLSWVLFVLTFVQIVIGLFQYLQYSMNAYQNKWAGLFWVLLLLAVIFVLIKTSFPKDK